MKEPLLCSLGFHKWRNCGNQVEVFWQEPSLVKGGVRRGIDTSAGVRRGGLGVSSRIVYEGRECKRCGTKLRSKFVMNPDGTRSAAGWELDTAKAYAE